LISIDKAERFMWLNARLLDRLRFEYHFRDGSAARVVAAIRPYQNPDGGFGNAIEPDARGPASQPTARAVIEFLDQVPDRARAEAAWKKVSHLILEGKHVAVDPDATATRSPRCTTPPSRTASPAPW
jgi:hypothetical protein